MSDSKEKNFMIGKELLAECRAKIAEQDKEPISSNGEAITFNIYDWKDAQDFANILIKNGHEVSIGPISTKTTVLGTPVPVTIFGFHSKK